MIASGRETPRLQFRLPAELVALRPSPQRDACRLLCVARGDSAALVERRFDALEELLVPGDLVVRNVSRVLPARLLGTRPSGGKAEILLVEPAADGAWWALVRPGRRLGPGSRVRLEAGIEIEVRACEAGGRRLVAAPGQDLADVARRHGRMPLPPYIRRDADARDRDDYQTVYAREEGSVAAPTAGLHFTPELLARLAARGVEFADVILHVGFGTFAPLGPGPALPDVLHAERFAIAGADLARIEAARSTGRRIVAVGTTVVRTLESVLRFRAGRAQGVVECASDGGGGLCGRTRLFVRPPEPVESVDALVTNFHLPQSSLLLLVQAFAGTAATERAYAHAIAARFRFYSYGDAMWIA